MKYQRLNANTLYVAAIFFSRSTLHKESLPCLPNETGRLSHIVVEIKALRLQVEVANNSKDALLLCLYLEQTGEIKEKG